MNLEMMRHFESENAEVDRDVFFKSSTFENRHDTDEFAEYEISVNRIQENIIYQFYQRGSNCIFLNRVIYFDINFYEFKLFGGSYIELRTQKLR